MKVVLLAPLPPPTGGIAGWTERMLKTQLFDDWEVEVVDEKLIINNIGVKEKKITHLKNEIIRCFKIWHSLSRSLKKKDVKIVHACIPAYTGSLLREIISAFITHLNRRKFIVHYRCTVPTAVRGNFGVFLLRRLSNLSDGIFVLNKKSYDYVISISKQKRIWTIPNFVSVSEISEEKKYFGSIRSIIYTGRIYSEKGCLDIIEVARRYPLCNFVLVGKIAMPVINIPDNVQLLGELDRKSVMEKLKEADVFMFLSNYRGEGFSNSLAEAMAYGLPCIVTDWAANVDMIENKGGFVVNKSDYDAIIKAINHLQDPKERERMGEWNRQKVIKMYKEEIITKMYVDSYKQIL